MRKKFILLTGRHDDAFHRTARGRFATERDATAFAEDARARGDFDWWIVAELDGDPVAESDDGPAIAARTPSPITTTAELKSHGFLIALESSSAAS